MGIRYENLDENVRRFMLKELESDIDNNRLYISDRLTEDGKQRWPTILREAIQSHNDDWIAEHLRQRQFIESMELRGGREVRIPSNAPEVLAEGEFNRFYMRGLCAFVLSLGETNVEVYRGRDAQTPRPESQALIGTHFSASQLLNDLRANVGIDTALGLPSGPNSGITIRRISTLRI